MGDFFGNLLAWATDLISTTGYWGIALLMAWELVLPAIPSEVILPLSGSIAGSGKLNIFLVVIAATVGSMGGSSLIYGIGRWGGEARIGSWLDKWGKWLLLSRKDLDRSTAWFNKYGTWAVLIARVVPGMRSIISIPAGISEMPFGRFLLLTAGGSAVWNTVLVLAGFFLGSNWQQVEGWIAPFSPLIYGLLILLFVWFVGRRLWERFGPGREKGDVVPKKADEGDI